MLILDYRVTQSECQSLAGNSFTCPVCRRIMQLHGPVPLCMGKHKFDRLAMLMPREMML